MERDIVILNSDRLADELNVHVRDLRNWVAKGLIPAKRMPGVNVYILTRNQLTYYKEIFKRLENFRFKAPALKALLDLQ